MECRDREALARAGADQLADKYKYVSVRRLALFIEESLYRGTQWVVFEPNDEPLWSAIRLNIENFMLSLFRQGAFQGSTPSQAFLVRCDKTTTLQSDIDLGIVNIRFLPISSPWPGRAAGAIRGCPGRACSPPCWRRS